MAHQVFTDSFSYDVANILQKWSAKTGTMTIAPTGGRRGAPALRCGAEASTNIRKYFTASACVTMGANIKVPADYVWGSTYTVLFAVYDSAGVLNCFVALNNSRGIEVYRNAYGNYGVGSYPVLLAISSPGVVPLNIDTYVEFGVTLSNTVGSIQVVLNGSNAVIPLISNIDTVYGLEHGAQAGYGTVNNGYGNGDKVWTTQCGLDYCDSYVAWGDEVALKGDCKVRKLPLTGDALPQDWPPSAGNAWERLNAGDGYISAAAVGDTSLFDFQDITDNSPLIHGVQVHVSGNKTDAGVREIAVVAKSGASEAESANIAMEETAQTYQRFMAVDPATAGAWSQAGLNAATLGLRVKV